MLLPTAQRSETGEVMFSRACAILFRGGGLVCTGGSLHWSTPSMQIHLRVYSQPRNTVNTWSVHILLECILVTTPRSEVSEGYVFTGVCHFNSGGGRSGPGHNTSPPPGPAHNTSLPPGPGHNPPSPPGTRSQHLPPPPPRDQVTTPPSPLGTRSQHLPHPRTRSQHLPPTAHLELCAGGRFAFYWNAFLLIESFETTVLLVANFILSSFDTKLVLLIFELEK